MLRNLKLTKDYKHELSILCQKNSHHNNLLDLVKYCDKYFDLYYAFYLIHNIQSIKANIFKIVKT